MTMRKYDELDDVVSLAMAVGATVPPASSPRRTRKNTALRRLRWRAPRVARCGIAISRGSADERRMWCGARELCTRRSFRVQKSLGWASNPGRFIPWLHIHRDVMSARQYCRRVNAGMLAGACRCADGMCLMCWRCVGSRTSEGAPPRSPRSRTPHHPIALRAKA